MTYILALVDRAGVLMLDGLSRIGDLFCVRHFCNVGLPRPL